MHKNPFWIALLLLFALITAWFSLEALYRLYEYAILSKESAAKVNEWSIREAGPESYKLAADYSFSVNEQTFDGTTIFNDWNYRNPWGAQAVLKEREARAWTAWYNPSNPHHSSLQKRFPLKECVSAGILWGLLLYFLWLGFYVVRYRR